MTRSRRARRREAKRQSRSAREVEGALTRDHLWDFWAEAQRLNSALPNPPVIETFSIYDLSKKRGP